MRIYTREVVRSVGGARMADAHVGHASVPIAIEHFQKRAAMGKAIVLLSAPGTERPRII